ncbi:MAG: tRNA lysidine(34) synthetase TilS [Bacteroidota bacterium]
MLKYFQSHIENNLPFLFNKRLLIAISGGLDSVVLTHLCHSDGLNIALAHCNFNLRGMESDLDEEFVINLADKLNLEVFVQNFSTEDYAEEQKISTQMAARELRYDWFLDLAGTLSFNYILTAHHADDNLETFLINFSRGTGISGLTGIPEVQGNIVRPLLPFSREELENYAQKENIEWREDSSNASEKYLRNNIRHNVIPALKTINPELLSSFKTTIQNLNDTADIVEESLNAVAKRAIVDLDENQIKFKISEFKKVNNPKAYLFEMFKAYGFPEWDDVLDLLDAQTGKQVFSETHQLLKDREHLILREIQSAETIAITIDSKESLNNKISFPNGHLEFIEADTLDVSNKNAIHIDKDKLKFPLEIRKWQEGDYFYPFGMNGKKKKISKFLKDEKLSVFEKENVWLLLSQSEIVWVMGLRADEQFKVLPSTDNVLKIIFKTN